MRTTTDIDIMILSETLNENVLVKLISCMEKNKISISLEELREMQENKIHISAFDEKSWVYRLDLKTIQTNIDKISIENVRYADIYN